MNMQTGRSIEGLQQEHVPACYPAVVAKGQMVLVANNRVSDVNSWTKSGACSGKHLVSSVRKNMIRRSECPLLAGVFSEEPVESEIRGNPGGSCR
jgi:hypothetical protein